MKESHYKSYDDLPLFLNAKTVAKVLGVSPSSGYELLHDPGFPVMRVGNRMVVPKEQFIQWVSEDVFKRQAYRIPTAYLIARSMSAAVVIPCSIK